MSARKKPKPAGVIETFYDSREAWMVGRLGKITGSGAHKTVTVKGNETKAGVWLAVAESIVGSLAIAEDELTSVQAMERGHELEPAALARFEQETGKKVRKGHIIWTREDDSRMAISPDGPIEGDMTAAVEVKCLLSAKHVEALYKRDIPSNTSGYEQQKLQYFISNPVLQTLYWIFYHPDFPAGLDYLCLTFTREELKDEIEKYYEAEKVAATKIRDVVNALTMFSPGEIAKMNEVKEELLASNAEVVAKAIKRVRTKRTTK